jgi:hypothetical protein
LSWTDITAGPVAAAAIETWQSCSRAPFAESVAECGSGSGTDSGADSRSDPRC